MSSAGEYIYSIIIAAVFVSVLLSITPDKSIVSSVIKLTAGIFLIIVVMAPLVKVRLSNTINYIENIETDASLIVREAQTDTANEIRFVIKQETETYILDKAADLGAEILAEVTIQKDGSYTPESITIIGAVSPLVKKQLSATIADELGIPEELQVWELS